MRVFNRRFAAIGTAISFVGPLLSVLQAGAGPCPTECASGKVQLGIVAPTSGQAVATAFGAQSLKPVEIGVQELNAAGGLMGIPVELTVADDKCDPGIALNVAKRQVEQDKINFVIGPLCPDAAGAVAQIYARAGVIQFLPTTPIATLGLTGAKPDNIFSMVATDEQEAGALGAYLAREQMGKKLTVVYTDASYNSRIVQRIKSALPDEMKSSVRFEPLLNISGVYDRLADKLQKDPPDVIYISLENERLVELVEKLRKRAVKSLLIGGQHMLSYNFWLGARAVAEGIQIIAPIGSPTTPELSKTIGLLRQAGVIPDLVALNSYATVQIWSEAIRRAGGGDSRKVIEVLRSGEFQTAVGPIAFDQQGNKRDTRYSVLTWQDGLPRLVEGRH